jgi:hypothetical protein
MISPFDPRHRPDDQTFTFIAPDFAGVFCVSLMARELLERFPVEMEGILCEAPLEESLVQHIVDHNGVEEPRVARLTPEYRDKPCLVADFEGKHVLIDGNHRMVRLWRDGIRAVKFYYLPRAIWQDYLMDVHPDTVRRAGLLGHSGVK